MGTLRVLTIDGGGMRGVYTAAFLNGLLDFVAQERGVDPKSLDLGKAFDLIVGTSTGAIIACAAAKGVPMADVVKLYREHGRKIFPMRLHADARTLLQFLTRPSALRSGAKSLEAALTQVLGETTFAELEMTRGIALAITAVEMSQQRSWVFKTGHWGGVRDHKTKLVDACMASSAAPIYRSLAAVPVNDGLNGFRVFADGGLWANNPILVGLVDALKFKGRESDDIEIYAAGTIPKPEGEQFAEDRLNKGLWYWKLGGQAAQLSIAAQEFAFDNMARMLSQILTDLGRKVEVIRFPMGVLQPSLVPFLDIDNASKAAVNALIGQARADVLIAKSACDDLKNPTGVMIRKLLSAVPGNRGTL